MLEWLRGLNALRVLAQLGAAEQIVGRERNQRASHRQVVRSAVARRRVNSTVRRLIAQTILKVWLSLKSQVECWAGKQLRLTRVA